MHSYKEFLKNDGENKWQDFWEKKELNKAVDFDKKPKKYILDMFPYPSGAGLHVGHPEGYTATDIYSRYFRMKGFNVLHPMGWDAFGLPAENYAIKTGTHPRETTAKNIATFKRQIQSLGFSYDWSREIDTTDPDYYKWTQWIFLQLFKKGLAYEATVPINFCPSCKTGLANEEVKDGKCDRCGTEVVKKDMRQWMLRITNYADRLLKGLDKLDWPESIKSQQRNWIGRSEGAEVDFAVVESGANDSMASADSSVIPAKAGIQNSESGKPEMTIRVYTTRPDTLFGATYMVLSPEHELIQNLKDKIKNFDEVNKYIVQAKNKSDLERTDLAKDKTGVELKGIKAVNPVNGKEIRIWISDYVLASYGTGAIMAVPAHDERDWEFAKKFGLEIVQVVAPLFGAIMDKDKIKPEKETVRRKSVYVIVKHWQDDSYYCLDWQEHNWRSFVMGGIEEGETAEEAAVRETKEETGYENIKSIKQISVETHNNYYAEHKGINRYAESLCFYIELQDGKRSNDIDVEHHQGEWIAKNKISEFINLPSHKWYWDELVKGEKAFTDIDNGVMINSEFLNGLKPSEVIGKMTAWLEENGHGKKAVNYKLRDWVFSRQRYWGEPIPLIYCEKCKNKKRKVLMIHGFEGNGDGNWFSWLKEKLQQQGFEVFNPTMTTAQHPVLEKWIEELNPYIEQMDENDIIIGHSLGAKAALNLIQKNNKKIGQLILVAPVLDKSSDEDYDALKEKWAGSDIESLKNFSAQKTDWNKVSELVKRKNVIFSEDDPYIFMETKEILPAGWSKELWQGFGHFQEKEIPEILHLILQNRSNGWFPVSENELPLTLPEVDKFEPSGTGESPLANIKEWVEIKCPYCGGDAKRETNTMPQWAGSSWYWLRYLDPQNKNAFADLEKLKYWLPVDVYVGGAEHAVLHLLYARFWNMVLFDLGYVPQEEPFAKLVNQGLILGEDSEKMSKSRGNVVNPDEVVAEHGADAFRMYEMFMGPLEDVKPWNTKGIVGIDRFLEKVWNMGNDPATVIPAKACLRRQAGIQSDNGLDILLNKTIKKVGEDIESMRFNTAISAMMILVNKFAESVSKEFYQKFLIILSPFAPHMAEELWSKLGNKESIFKESWPSYDESKIKDEKVEIVVQINGKVRGKVSLPAGTAEAQAVEAAKNEPNVKKYLENSQIKKTIFVPNKLISFVI